MNRLYFWKNFIGRDRSFQMEESSLVLSYVFSNRLKNTSLRGLLFLPNINLLTEYIYYYILPTAFISRLLQNTGDIIVAIEREDELLYFLRNNSYMKRLDIIDDYIYNISKLSQLAAKEINSWEYEYIYSNNWDHRELFFSNIKIYESLSLFAKDFIENPIYFLMLDRLKQNFNYSNKDIINLFKDLDRKPFIRIRLQEFLFREFRS